YIAGSTLSGDFPLAHPLQSRFGGGTNLGDAFVTELNASGDRLVYSTYLGGSREDDAEAIAVSGGNAYIAGRTDSSNFRTASPLQASLGGGTCHYDFIQTGTAACFDAFVARIGRSGISLRFSTYLGGNGSDFAFGIAVHGGNVYVAGQTDSTNLKAHSVDTRAGIQSSLRTGTCSPDGAARRCSDAFVSEIAGSGKRVIYNTYLGGNGEDYANALAVDRAGNAYVVGDTQSSNFPLVAPFRSKFTGGPDMAFVAKVASGGGKLVYSTYLGGSDGDEAYGVAVDRAGDAFVTGRTSSPNFPVSNPVQRTIRTVAGDPPQNAFLTELNPSGNGLVYSTFLGGSNHDSGNGIALDAAGNAYLTGFASSTNFPVIHPIQSSLRGGVYDAMVAKIGNPNAVLPSHRTTEKPCKTGFERVHGTCARGQRKGA
ncbi:MAG TPA: SBBP repeat-containing protein, partial [Chloroflexota bacterium]